MDIEEADGRAAELAQAFVELAGALASGYDVVELLDRLVQHCVHLLAVDAAGLVLTDASGTLHVMAATSEQARFLEVLQLHADSGPCLDCYRTGQPVNVDDLTAERNRWPGLANTVQHGWLPRRARRTAAVPGADSRRDEPVHASSPGAWQALIRRSPGRWPRWRRWRSWASA